MEKRGQEIDIAELTVDASAIGCPLTFEQFCLGEGDAEKAFRRKDEQAMKDALVACLKVGNLKTGVGLCFGLDLWTGCEDRTAKCRQELRDHLSDPSWTATMRIATSGNV
ncbi:hypothetical protein CDD83_9972 [Cordyceps sp. RAO-2017]|nr:hypothetical protein CDD83_9972 [Cordyceps sp. RAO-2017]